MGVCDPCTKADPVPMCVTDLTIGDISSPNEPVYVYERNIATDRLERYAVTSSGAGSVVITPTGVMAEQNYEYWIVKQSATSIDARETITIGTATMDCVTIQYTPVQNGDELQSYTAITLTTS